MPHVRPPASLSLVPGSHRRDASDGDVARALIAGHTWAAAETWHRFAPMVVGLARRTLGSRAEADDVAQDVFDRVYRKVGRLEEPDSFRNFIYTCAVRVLQTELTRRKMRAWLSFAEPALLETHAREAMDLEGRDLLRRFYVLLDKMAPRDRIVFVLRRMEGMEVEEIALATKLSPATVKRSVAKTTLRLSRWLEEGARGR